jgi:hypothetical protein
LEHRLGPGRVHAAEVDGQNLNPDDQQCVIKEPMASKGVGVRLLPCRLDDGELLGGESCLFGSSISTL